MVRIKLLVEIKGEAPFIYEMRDGCAFRWSNLPEHYVIESISIDSWKE